MIVVFVSRLDIEGDRFRMNPAACAVDDDADTAVARVGASAGDVFAVWNIPGDTPQPCPTYAATHTPDLLLVALKGGLLWEFDDSDRRNVT